MKNKKINKTWKKKPEKRKTKTLCRFATNLSRLYARKDPGYPGINGSKLVTPPLKIK